MPGDDWWRFTSYVHIQQNLKSCFDNDSLRNVSTIDAGFQMTRFGCVRLGRLAGLTWTGLVYCKSISGMILNVILQLNMKLMIKSDSHEPARTRNSYLLPSSSLFTVPCKESPGTSAHWTNGPPCLSLISIMYFSILAPPSAEKQDVNNNLILSLYIYSLPLIGFSHFSFTDFSS